jgi:cytochrome P460
MRVVSILAGLLLASSMGDGAPGPEAPADSAPRYTASGELRRPEGYRTWVFVGASLGLSYREGAAPGADEFHHVYLRPESYDAYRRTGRFPDKTVLVLELHEAAQKAEPARHGVFEGKRVALEAAVKDVARFPEQWAYFSFGDGTRETASAFPKSRCFDCHREHAAADNVFIQFYPVLRDGAH